MPASPVHKLFRHAMLLGLLLLAAPLRAEELGWEACVQELAANNAELRAAQLNLSAARERALAARSGFFPQVSAGVSHSDSESSTITTTTSGYSASVTATQNLFAGFQDSARVEQAEGNRAVAEANLAAVRARLSQELKSAYAGLLYAQDNVVLTTKIAQRTEENLRLVELRFEGGRENRGSFLLTRASLSQARYDQLQARQALVTARTQLARALGRREPGELTVSGLVPVAEPAAPPDFAALAREVPDYRLVSAQENVATADVRLARSGFYPSVDLTGTLAREGSNWFPEDDRRTVVTSVTVPLFSGGRDYYTTRAASESLTAAGANKDNVERQALVLLRQGWARYVESAEKLKVDADFVEAANIRATIARSKYNNGLMSFEDWDRIENELILRNKTFLFSQRERVLAEAAWEQAQGKGVIP
jgi:outer membrane protein TolC